MAQTKTNVKNNKTAEAAEMLAQGVKHVFSSENFRNYLDTMSKFHHYSINNTILIYMQRPDASVVAGYQAWEKNFHRHVKKGEKGLKIFAPCKGKAQLINADGEEVEKVYTYFRVATVFDISQTEGEELPEIAKPLHGKVEGFSDVLARMIAISPVPVSFGASERGELGCYDRCSNSIKITAGLSELQTIKTLIHEIAHSMLHSEDQCVKTHAQKETEAEGTAYIVANALGLDTSGYSFEYIAGWTGEKDTKTLTEALDTIKRTADEIINRYRTAEEV